MPDSPAALLLRNAATAAASFLAIVVGLHALRGFSGAGGEPLVSPIWPATGVHLALVWLWGYRVLPGLVIGAALGNLTSSPELPRLFAYTSAQTVEVVACAWLLFRLAGDRSPELVTRRAAFSLLAAGIVGPLAGAIVLGVLLKFLVAPGIGRGGLDVRFWSAWLIADGLSALVVTPVVISWRERRPIPWTRYPRLQAVCLAAGLLATSWVLFAQPAVSTWLATEPLIFVTIPFLVWAALAFGAFGASIALLALSIVSIAATLHGRGPFAAMPPVQGVLMLQIYLGVTGGMSVLLGASTCARGAAHRALEEQNLHVRRLLDELDHRVKNNLASLMGLTQMARSDPARLSLERFESRIIAMGRAHTLLAQSRWTETRMAELVRGAAGPAATEPGRLALLGDDPLIPAEQCQAIVLALHELAEHSRRHGTWAGDEGRVTVHVAADPRHVTVRWQEPPLADREGASGDAAGRTELQLARGFVVHELRGSMEVRGGGRGRDGLEIILRIPPPTPAAPRAVRGAGEPVGAA